MKKAHYDKTTGKLLGWYDDSIHAIIPIPNIEVSEAGWKIAIDDNANYVNVNLSTLVVKDLRTQADLNAAKLQEIDTRLNAIDVESVRPLRAISNNTATSFDIDKITALDTEAETLRTERSIVV